MGVFFLLVELHWEGFTLSQQIRGIIFERLKGLRTSHVWGNFVDPNWANDDLKLGIGFIQKYPQNIDTLYIKLLVFG